MLKERRTAKLNCAKRMLMELALGTIYGGHIVRSFMLAVSLALCISACGGGGDTDIRDFKSVGSKVAMPDVDLSTPDRAIKSYWATLDAIRMTEHEMGLQVRSHFREAAAPLNSLFTAEVRRTREGRETAIESFNRDIASVEVETESRAVIVATIRNTTPIPEGAELSRYDEERRRDGERYRYVLEREGDGWLVAEVWAYRDYRKDWDKMIPSDPTPMVPSLTYNGH